MPTVAERRANRANGRLDPTIDNRVIEFGRFRQEEMASFINELGAELTVNRSLSFSTATRGKSAVFPRARRKRATFMLIGS